MKRRFRKQGAGRDRLDWTCAELEPRLMLAGDAAAAVASIADGSHPDHASAACEVGAAADTTSSSLSSAPHLVIVDSSIADETALLNAVPDHADLVVLSPGKDPIDQIDGLLQSRRQLQSVHVLCHGSQGAIQLGQLQVNHQVLTERAAEIRSWGKAFADGGDFLLYGCNVAEGQGGAEFLRQLAELTGVDVAASSDQTGSVSTLQGDWDLEWHEGVIEHNQLLAVEALERYQGSLAISGAGFNLNGSASIFADQLQLTGTGTRQAGSAFVTDPIAVDGSTSFQSVFTFQIGGGSGSGGADGMAFLLQNSAAGADALEHTGGFLGYDSITPSLAIEFDTYRNGGDLAANTIAVVLNGATRNALQESPALFDLNNGNEYHAWIDYRGDTDSLEVFLSDSDQKPGSATLTTQVELDQIVGSSAYAGFSAGNYDIPNYHRVSSWDFATEAPPASPGSFSLATSQINTSEGQAEITLEVQRLGGSAGEASIEYRTEGLGAVAGEDFVDQSDLLLFADGETSKQITIQILDDGDEESSEEFLVHLENPIGAQLQSPQTARVTILDDDAGLPSYGSFSSAEGLNFNGSASLAANQLQLTSTGTRQAGTAFFDSAIAVDSSTSFQSAFSFQIDGGSGTGGADGLAFLLQNSADGADALGGVGGNLGYSDIDRSVAIEFDTYRNGGDSAANTIAVVIDGKIRNALSETAAGFDLNDGTRYYAWVDYDGASNQLEVYLSDADAKPVDATLTTELDLAEVVGSTAYAGFSAGNYDLPNFHRISSWYFTQEAPPASPGGFSLATSQINTSEGQAEITLEVQRLGGSAGEASIEYRTEGLGAVAGEDFVDQSDLLLFADGETSKQITIQILDDGDEESSEEFLVHLENPIGAQLQSPQTARVTILDDDAGLPSYGSFSSAEGLNFNGSASLAANQLQLTSTGTRQAGTAFFDSAIAVDSSTSFQSAFSFQIDGGSGTGGADGLAFLLQNSADGADALGGVGGNLGYSDIDRSVAIEFDTYRNGGDSAANTIAVVIDGKIRNALSETAAGFDLNDGTRYYAWVDYDGASNQLEVYLSDADAKPVDATLTTELDLAEVVGSTAYAGFSAGNYDLPNFHRISSWYFTQEAPPASPGGFSLATSQITTSEGQAEITLEVQRLGGSAGDAWVDYLTIGDSAVAGEDFVEENGTLFFADGDMSQQFTITIIDDGDGEPTEEFAVTIDNPVGADLLAPRTSLIRILDDDSGLPIFPTFESAVGLDLNGSAMISADELQLTSTEPRQAGTAFFNAPIAVDSSTSFQSAFSFRIDGGSGSGGADGMTFLLQNSASGGDALGGVGGSLGYGGIDRSVAIEFDTYQNGGDSAANTIAVVIDGNTSSALAEAPALFDLNNGTQYYAWVDYNADSDVLAVYLSDSPEKPFFALLKTQLDLSQIVGNSAYAGFSAGNYDTPNYHHVTSWNFSLDTPPADPPLNPTGDIVKQDIFTGLVQPLSLAWSPDGRNIYIGEKGGVVKVARDGSTNPTVLLDISAQVNNVQDRGLLDIALHPEFQSNGYLYLLYTYDPPEVFDNVGNTNAEPDGRGNRVGRLMQVQADASTGFTTIVPGSEKILLGTNSTWENFNAFADSTTNLSEPQAGYDPVTGYLRDFINSDSRSHTVGSLAFANDGSLFVSIGDGGAISQTDPRALRVQDVESLSGKVLRIDPITGEGLADNPFYNNDPDSNQSKVYQLGLRNPWRLTYDEQSDRLWIGETGWSSFEEINTGAPAANFGWPFYEGAQGFNSQTPGYSSLPQAQNFYQSTVVTPPVIALQHQAGSDAIVLGDILHEGDLGIQYEGDIFFNDLYRGVVRHASIDASGQLLGISTFVTNASFVVDIQQGPDGSLYYANLVDGTVGKWLIV